MVKYCFLKKADIDTRLPPTYMYTFHRKLRYLLFYESFSSLNLKQPTRFSFLLNFLKSRPFVTINVNCCLSLVDEFIFHICWFFLWNLFQRVCRLRKRRQSFKACQPVTDKKINLVPTNDCQKCNGIASVIPFQLSERLQCWDFSDNISFCLCRIPMSYLLSSLTAALLRGFI